MGAYAKPGQQLPGKSVVHEREDYSQLRSQKPRAILIGMSF